MGQGEAERREAMCRRLLGKGREDAECIGNCGGNVREEGNAEEEWSVEEGGIQEEGLAD